MEALAASVISLVSPYLSKGAEEFAKEAGKEAFAQVKALIERLALWWKGDAIAGALVSAFPAKPVDAANMLGMSLAAALNNDASFADDVGRLVSAVDPYVEVVQRIKVAEGVTGAEIGEMLRGKLRVLQEMDTAKDVTGAKIGTLR
jgi:hypothetical protein